MCAGDPSAPTRTPPRGKNGMAGSTPPRPRLGAPRVYKSPYYCASARAFVMASSRVRDFPEAAAGFARRFSIAWARSSVPGSRRFAMAVSRLRGSIALNAMLLSAAGTGAAGAAAAAFGLTAPALVVDLTRSVFVSTSLRRARSSSSRRAT